MPQPAPDRAIDPVKRPGAERPDFAHLPEPIRLAQTTTGQPASDAPSPDFGRDPDHEWMLRFSAG